MTTGEPSNGARDTISFRQLTGHEVRAIRQAIGRSVGVAAQEGDPEIAYALEWIRRRRNDPQTPYGDVLALPISEVIHHLDGIDDEDPTMPRSGSSSPASATSGE